MADLITQRLLEAIAEVESRNNPNAIGDVGLQFPAVGAFQMRRPAFEDVLRLRPEFRNRKFEQLIGNRDLQMEMAMAYLQLLNRHYGLNTIDNLLAGYNAGPTAVRRGRIPVSTRSYIERVKALLGE